MTSVATDKMRATIKPVGISNPPGKFLLNNCVGIGRIWSLFDRLKSEKIVLGQAGITGCFSVEDSIYLHMINFKLFVNSKTKEVLIGVDLDLNADNAVGYAPHETGSFNLFMDARRQVPDKLIAMLKGVGFEAREIEERGREEILKEKLDIIDELDRRAKLDMSLMRDRIILDGLKAQINRENRYDFLFLIKFPAA